MDKGQFEELLVGASSGLVEEKLMLDKLLPHKYFGFRISKRLNKEVLGEISEVT